MPSTSHNGGNCPIPPESFPGEYQLRDDYCYGHRVSGTFGSCNNILFISKIGYGRFQRLLSMLQRAGTLIITTLWTPILSKSILTMLLFDIFQIQNDISVSSGQIYNSGMKKKNVLFITTDQQQKATMGCYGNNLIETPHLDALAQSGIVLDRAYCENPICIPSRNTMITGRKSIHHQATVHNSSLPDNEICLGDYLKQKGYETHFIGKPHFKSQQEEGTEESLEDWRNGLYDNWNGPYKGFNTAEIILGHSNPLTGHYGKWMKSRHKDKIKHFAKENLNPADVSCGQGVFLTNIPEEVHSSTYVGDRTSAYLKKMAVSEKPFYCFCSFPDPHWPLMTPPQYYKMYNDCPIDTSYEPLEKDPNLENYPDNIKKYMKTGRMSDFDGGGHKVTENRDIETITRAYWGAISLIDKNIGRIMKTLEDEGLRDDTLVIFTTDHGEYMGAHGMMAKGGVCWEEYINVPFIASFPGIINANTRCDGLFSFTDIVPTILDFLGYMEEKGLPAMPFDGISQKSLLQGDEKHTRRSLTVHHAKSTLSSSASDQHVLIRHDGWKLIYHAGEKGGQLYNLINDPKETRNLYNLTDYSDIQAKLITELMDTLILEINKKPIIESLNSDDQYTCHVMTREVWGDELYQE
ncbi:MAG: sulfatase-like hydrolase/transferase [Spirochaetales bacterium]|nr:sulfatase-like hydrolase/transferase [Spirochaetales bacterium]